MSDFLNELVPCTNTGLNSAANDESIKQSDSSCFRDLNKPDNETAAELRRPSWRENLRSLQLLYDQDEFVNSPIGTNRSVVDQNVSFQHDLNESSGLCRSLPEYLSKVERNLKRAVQDNSFLSDTNSGIACTVQVDEEVYLQEKKEKHENSENSKSIQVTDGVFDETVDDEHNNRVSSALHKPERNTSIDSETPLTYESDRTDDLHELISGEGQDCVKELTASLNISSLLENPSDLDDSFWDPGSDSVDTELDEALNEDGHQESVLAVIVQPHNVKSNSPADKPLQGSAKKSAQRTVPVSIEDFVIDMIEIDDLAKTDLKLNYDIAENAVPLLPEEDAFGQCSPQMQSNSFRETSNGIADASGVAFSHLHTFTEIEVPNPDTGSAENISGISCKEFGEKSVDLSSSSHHGKQQVHNPRKHSPKKNQYSRVECSKVLPDVDLHSSDATLEGSIDTEDAQHAVEPTQSPKATDHEESTHVSSGSQHFSYLSAIDTVMSSPLQINAETYENVQQLLNRLQIVKDSDTTLLLDTNSRVVKKLEDNQEKRLLSEKKLPETKTSHESKTAGVKLRDSQKIHRRKSYRIATVFKAAHMSPSSFDAQCEELSELEKSAVTDQETISHSTNPELGSSVIAVPEVGKENILHVAASTIVAEPELGHVAIASGVSQEDAERSTLFGTFTASAAMKGNLDLKISHIDGKRLGNRSWKTIYALIQNEHLYIYTDATMKALVCNPPISVQYCRLDIVLNLRSRKVFRLLTQTRSSYLFAAENEEVMKLWITALSKVVPHDAIGSTSKSHTKMVERSVDSKTTTDSKKPQAASQMTSESAQKAQPTTTSHKQPSEVVTGKSAEKEKNQQKDAKNWKARFADKFRSTISSESSSSTVRATFGVPLDKCVTSPNNELVPLLVEVCVRKIEENGLSNKGIYRVPGNTASITSLQADIDKDPSGLNLDCDKWNDVNVVISILKMFFRKLPESLATDALYPHFIAANTMNADQKLAKIKYLLFQLPKRNFATFHVIARHLSRVASMENMNMMNTRNLAVIFGPTLIQPRDSTMLNMVKEMSAQCQIVEAIILNYEWLFTAPDEVDGQLVAAPIPSNSVQSNAPISGMDHILQEKAENLKLAVKEDKERDLKRILRRVTTRSKPARKSRSKSAHVDLRVAYSERNIDDEVAKKAAEQGKDDPKETNEKLERESITVTVTRKRSGSLSRLPVEPSTVSAAERGTVSPAHMRKKAAAAEPVVAAEMHRPLASEAKRYHKSSEKVKLKHLSTKASQETGSTSMTSHLGSQQGSSSRLNAVLSDDGESRSSRNIDDPASNLRPEVHSAMSYLGSSRGLAGPTSLQADSRKKQAAAVPVHRPGASRHRQPAVAPVPLKKWMQPAEIRPVFSELDITSSVFQHEITPNPSTTADVVTEPVRLSSESAPKNTEIDPMLSSLANGRRHESLPNLSPRNNATRKLADPVVVVDDVPLLEIPVVPKFRVTEKKVWNLDTSSWEDAYSPLTLRVVPLDSDWISEGSLDSILLPGSSVSATSNHDAGQSKLRFESFSKPDVADGVVVRATSDKSYSTTEISMVRPRMKRALRALENLTSTFPAVVEKRVGVSALQVRHSFNENCLVKRHCDDQYKRSTWPLYRQSSLPVVVTLDLKELSVQTGSVPTRAGDKRTARPAPDVKSSVTTKRRARGRRSNVTAASQSAHSQWIGHGDLIGTLLSYESSV